MKSKRFLFLPFLIVSLSLTLPLGLGCKKTLEPGGAYSPVQTNATTGAVTAAPDIGFFTADSAFWAAFTTIDTVFTLERDNRALFESISPEIKHSLDKIRPTAVDVRNGYLKARQAYMAHPTPEGLQGIEEILAKLQQLAVAVSAALPQSSTNVLAPQK